jgi:Tfp pilus assembly pilus retraction ATPase PilT
MKEGGFHGMQTFDQALLNHVVSGGIKLDAVLPYVRNTHELKAKAQAAGVMI